MHVTRRDSAARFWSVCMVSLRKLCTSLLAAIRHDRSKLSLIRDCVQEYQRIISYVSPSNPSEEQSRSWHSILGLLEKLRIFTPIFWRKYRRLNFRFNGLAIKMYIPTSSMARPGRVLVALTIFLVTYLVYGGHLSPSIYDGPRSHPASKPQASFAIISMTTSETTYDWMSFSNKYVYAMKHGYDLIWDFEPSRDYIKVWEKLNLSRYAIESSLSGQSAYEWIWMLDFDTLITNTSIQISDVVEQSLALAEEEGKSRADVNLILTCDCDPLNLGSFFLRASPWTLDFIAQWRAGAAVLDDHGKLRNEQDVLRDMLHDNAFSVAEKSVIAPQWMFDAYPEELECYDPRDPRPWEPGMFLLHFAGARWRFKGQKDPIGTLMRKYFHAIV